MDSDNDGVMDMNQEELQNWIRAEVKKNMMVDLSPFVRRCQLLLEKREKQRAGLLKLTESVNDCETVIRQLYLLLGWDYSDGDCDDELVNNAYTIKTNDIQKTAVSICGDNDGDPMDCDENPELKHPFETTPQRLKADGSNTGTGNKEQSNNLQRGEPSCSLAQRRRPVVMLSRITESEIRSALRSPSPKKVQSDDDAVDEDEDFDDDVVVQDGQSSKSSPKKVQSDDDAVDEDEDFNDDVIDQDGQSSKSSPKKVQSDDEDSDDDVIDQDGQSSKSSPKKVQSDDDDEDSDDDVIDEDWKMSSSSDSDSDSDESWNGKATARAKGTKTRKRFNGNTKNLFTKKKQNQEHCTTTIQTNLSPAAIVEKEKKLNQGGATSTELACGIIVSTVPQSGMSHEATKPPNLPEEKIRLNMKVLARKKGRKWLPGEIVEMIPKEGGNEFKYKVNLEVKGRILVSGHHIAFGNIPLLERLFVGARVVTKYHKGGQSFFYSGILGELPSRRNRMRFLVFFDDHTPTYVGLPFLHMVCRPLADAWEDIADTTHRNFIKEYLKVWPYPPMAHYNMGQMCNAECEEIQMTCEVVQLDCSLIRVAFKDDGREEWIYRGSMRLAHLVAMKKILQENESDEKSSKPSSVVSTENPPAESAAIHKPVAIATVNFTPHDCGPACLEQIGLKGNAEGHRKHNPLLVPMMYKFRRIKKQATADTTTRGHTHSKPSSDVYYYAPCGRTLSSMVEVEDYLQKTHCGFLSVDAFSMDACVSVTGSAKTPPFKVFIPDLTIGVENKAVPCINEHNSIRPARFSYESKRDASAVVDVDASLDFMAGCECRGGCQDSVSCSCRQLTIQSTRVIPGGPVDDTAGYAQKRLNRGVITGVYECNAQCGCDPRMCSNRVVQQGIQLRLQVFMTQGRGWGVRCMDDVPKGTFVCAYSGKVVRGDKKSMKSNSHYVRLNHVEGAEMHKEDYETEVYCSDSDTEGANVVASETANIFVKRKTPNASAIVPITSRGLADGEDCCYIIDAKEEGNVARFLNHNCSPNLFRQNVFVDTHDLRFPWLTFFTCKRIKSGTELTWNYRAVKDSAETCPGQSCHCGSKNCSGKL